MTTAGDDDAKPDVRGSTLERSALLARLPEATLLELTVVGASTLTPAMRRLRLGAKSLATFTYEPGQDLMVAVPADDGTTYRRRYTIRRLDPVARTLDLDVVVHGDGPGARWATAAGPGDPVEAIGPRGKVTLDPDADWHLFVGDESALPVTAAMVEALGPGRRAVVVIEVAGPEERQDLDAAGGCDLTVHWRHRGTAAPGTGSQLLDTVAALGLPEGTGHAYLNGELATVGALRRALAERMDPGRISMKPYWRRGVANAAHGEPNKD